MVELEVLLVGVDMADVRSVLTTLEMESVLEATVSVVDEVVSVTGDCEITALELMELMLRFDVTDATELLLRVNGAETEKAVITHDVKPVEELEADSRKVGAVRDVELLFGAAGEDEDVGTGGLDKLGDSEDEAVVVEATLAVEGTEVDEVNDNVALVPLLLLLLLSLLVLSKLAAETKDGDFVETFVADVVFVPGGIELNFNEPSRAIE